MFVKEIMSKNLACCTKDTSLVDVARLMRDRDCGALPVVDADAIGNKLVGIVTDRDLVVRALADGADLSKLTAGDCMSMVVATVSRFGRGWHAAKGRFDRLPSWPHASRRPGRAGSGQL